MFERSPDRPLVSVLMPTRGRPHWLCEAVDSLYSLAANQANIECIFKLDTDDTASIDAVKELAKLIPCTTLISDRGKGYLDLYCFLNTLSGLARGDWLFVFNDDARMKTQGWDEVLERVNPHGVPGWGGSDEVCLLGPSVTEREISWEFPILRRRTYEILGHFSRSCFSDTYIYSVLSDVNAALLMPQIEISHFINDIDDTTKREGKLHAEKLFMKRMDDPSTQKLYEEGRSRLRLHLARKISA